jgi:formylglycine-generating enzyme required for sulfatase activity
VKALHFFVIVAALCAASAAEADTFGTGANQFTIDFVTISGDASSANGTNIGYYLPGNSGGYRSFAAPTSDYRMGVYEITNDQWAKFKAELGVPVTGSYASAYDEDPSWLGANVPTNRASWWEAAQFVNWLNTSTGHQAAYKFTGTQGTDDYTMANWDAAEAAGGTNLYRHKDAFYFLPTEDEWVMAAYWNGAVLQEYATKAGESFHQGDGISGTGWNYYDNYEYATDNEGPWDVGSGSEELNGTFDMMGNIWEWTESPYQSLTYGQYASRAVRGGTYYSHGHTLGIRGHNPVDVIREYSDTGFRVASQIPEPATMSLLALGGLALLLRKRKWPES